MILLDVDPNWVRPGWTPLFVTLLSYISIPSSGAPSFSSASPSSTDVSSS